MGLLPRNGGFYMTGLIIIELVFTILPKVCVYYSRVCKILALTVVVLYCSEVIMVHCRYSC